MKNKKIVLSIISGLILLNAGVSPVFASEKTYYVVNNSYSGQRSESDGTKSQAESYNSRAVIYHTEPNNTYSLRNERKNAERTLEREKKREMKRIAAENRRLQRELEQERKRESRRIAAENRRLQKELADRRFSVSLRGDQYFGDKEARGTAQVLVRPGKNEVCVTLRVKNSEQATAAHIHKGGRGVDGPVVITLPTPNADGYANGCVGADTALLKDMKINGYEYYVDIHNAPYPNGIVRGQLRN